MESSQASPLSQEERELAATHLRDRVANHISEETLRAYTKGDIEEAAMPQCSNASKRGREGADVTEDTRASSRQPPSISQTAAIPPPQQEQQEPPTRGSSIPTLLREIGVLLVEGTPNETITNLLAAPAKRDVAMKTWNAWKPFLSHHPKFPISEAQVKKDIFKILATAYASSVAREEAAEYLRAYAESAFTSAAFIDHTADPVEDEMVRPHPTAKSLQIAVPPLTRPFSLTGVRTPVDGTPSRLPTSGPILKGACDGVPYDPRTLAGRHPQPDPPTSARMPLQQPGNPTSRHHLATLLIYITAPRAQAPLCNKPPHPIGADTLTSTNPMRTQRTFANPHAHTQTLRNSSPPHI